MLKSPDHKAAFKDMKHSQKQNDSPNSYNVRPIFSNVILSSKNSKQHPPKVCEYDECSSPKTVTDFINASPSKDKSIVQKINQSQAKRI